ncbi:hypothetical protein [Motilimonas pumila]|uniref:Uncharacterized protein n=1 Tax=Motilimonas pumila TaxID=2303987 RepID=A0A418Y8Y5_9GAMM|nr:hypothetical protein [Motilimonas pumila]RJG35085.1 hypothetical protein D1Z90_20985 [Motilimonas pumila]
MSYLENSSFVLNLRPTITSPAAMFGAPFFLVMTTTQTAATSTVNLGCSIKQNNWQADSLITETDH